MGTGGLRVTRQVRILVCEASVNEQFRGIPLAPIVMFLRHLKFQVLWVS